MPGALETSPASPAHPLVLPGYPLPLVGLGYSQTKAVSVFDLRKFFTARSLRSQPTTHRAPQPQAIGFRPQTVPFKSDLTLS